MPDPMRDLNGLKLDDLPVILREQQRLVHSNNALHRAAIERETKWEQYRSDQANEMRQINERCQKLEFALDSLKNGRADAHQIIEAINATCSNQTIDDTVITSRIASLEAAISLRNAEIARLASLIEEAASYDADTLKSRGLIADLRSSNHKLESRVEFLIQAQAQSDEQLRALESRGITRSAQQLIDQKERALRDAAIDLQKANQKNKKLVTQLEHAELESFSLAEEKVAHLQQLEQMKADFHDALNASRNEIDKLQADIVRAESARTKMKDEYETQLRELNLFFDSRYQVSETRDELRRVTNERDKLTNDIEKVNRSYAELQAEMNIGVGKLEAQNADLKKEIVQLKERLIECRSERDAAHIAARQSQLECARLASEDAAQLRKFDHLQADTKYWKDRFYVSDRELRETIEKLSDQQRSTRELTLRVQQLETQLEQVRGEWDRCVEENHRISMKFTSQEIELRSTNDMLAAAKCELQAFQAEEATRKSTVTAVTHDPRVNEAERIIGRQNNALDALKQELGSVYEKLNTERIEKEQLCTMMKLVDDNLVKIQSELTALMNEKRMLQLEINQSKEQNVVLNQTIKQRDEKINIAENDKRAATQTISDLEAEIVRIKAALRAAEDSSEDAIRSSQSLRSRLTWLEDELTRATERETGTQQKLFESEKKVRTLMISQSDATSRIESLTHERNLIGERAKAFEQQVRDLSTLISQMDAINSERDAELRLTADQVRKLNEQAQNKQSEMTTLQSQLHEAKQTITSILTDTKSVRDELERCLNDTRNELSSTQSHNAKLETTVKQLQTDLVLFETNRNEALDHRTKLETQITSLEATIRNHEVSQRSRQNELDSASKDINLVANENHTLQSQLRLQRDEIDELRRANEGLHVQLSLAAHDASKIESDLNDVLESCRQQSLEIDRLNLALVDSETIITKYRNQLTNCEAETTRQSLSAGQQTQALAAAMSEADAWRKQNEEMSRYLLQLRSDLSNAMDELRDARHQLTVMRHVVDSTDAGRVQAQRQAAHYAQALEIAGNEVERKGNDHSAAAREIADLKEKISALEIIGAQSRRELAIMQRDALTKHEQATKMITDLVAACEQHRSREIQLNATIDQFKRSRDRGMHSANGS